MLRAVICQSGVWNRSSDLQWVGGEGQRLQMLGANGQTMWLENINGRFRLVNSAWTAELFSVDKSGNVFDPRGRIDPPGSLCGGASYLNGYGWYSGAACNGVTLPSCPGGYSLMQVGPNLLGSVGTGAVGAAVYACIKN